MGGWTRRGLFAAAGVGVLAGCATVPAPGGSAAGRGPQDTSNKLRILTNKQSHTAATVAEFRRRNPRIDLQVTFGSVSFEEGSAQTLLRSGKGPDLLLVNSGPGRVGLLAKFGLLASLDDVFAKHDILSRYRPDVIAQTRQPRDGRIYEVVEGIDVFQVYYNKKIFARHQIAVPRTWAEFLAVCAKLTAARVPPLVAGVRDNFGGGWLLGTLLQASAGRDAVSAAIKGTGSFSHPDLVRGAEMLKELLDRRFLDGRQTAALDAGQAGAAFLKGSAAMAVLRQGDMVNGRADGLDVSGFDAFPMPPVRAGMPALPTGGLAVSWVVNNTTEAFSAVDAWMDWISSEDYLALAAAHGSSLVPTRKVPPGAKLDPFVRRSLDRVTAGIGFNPSVYLSDAGKDAWYQAVQSIVAGSRTPAAAMESVRAAVSSSRAK